VIDTPPGGTVDFKAGLTGTITLTSGELDISKDLTIGGPGAAAITVSGDHAFRVFNIPATVSAVISDLTITNGNSGSNSGGGIDNAGTLTITGSTICDNTAEAGGGIESIGTLTLTSSIISGNTAVGAGGMDSFGPATITDSVISGNTAVNAAGITFVGPATVLNCTISGNSASGSGSFIEGGGINVNGGNHLTIISSTISGNSVTGPTFAEGGGIFASVPSTVTIINSTMSGNSATGGFTGAGGGIFDDFSTLTLVNSTISSNSALGNFIGGGEGGGLDEVNGTQGATMQNTILAGNIALLSPDLSGPLNSQGHNLVGNGTGGSGFAATDLVGTAANPISPLVGPLADNGGPTQTMALLPGSPALNAGDPTQLGVADQRGVVRSGGVNIGAYQATASAFLLNVPAKVRAGMPFDVTVTAVDPFGQVAVGYAGTVTFSTSDPDPNVVLPADYTFTLADAGVHTFTDTGLGETTLLTHGDQTLTVSDTADGSLVGIATLKVKRTHQPDSLNGSPSPGQARADEDLFFASLGSAEGGLLLAGSKHPGFGAIEPLTRPRAGVHVGGGSAGPALDAPGWLSLEAAPRHG
jgi:hypothetical protein